VYASQPGSPPVHATLGSGWWPTFTGSGLSPAGSQRRFPSWLSVYMTPPPTKLCLAQYLIDFIDTKNGALTVPFRGFSCLLRDSAPATGGAESKSVPLLEPTVRSRPGNLYALVCSRVALGNQTSRSCGHPSSGITRTRTLGASGAVLEFPLDIVGLYRAPCR